MSQVDDWSDGYTSDYLRDLNTYGPASANVPRTSSVVSHQVRYRAPDTSDIPLAPGQNPEDSVYSNASGARMGQTKPASGYRAPAGGGYTAQTFPHETAGRRYAPAKKPAQVAKKSAVKKTAVKKQSQAEYHTGGALTQDESNVAERAASHRQSDLDWGELNGQALDAAARFLPALRLLSGFGVGAGAEQSSTDIPETNFNRGLMGGVGRQAEAIRKPAPESSSIEDQFKNMPWYKDAKAHHEAVKKNMDDYGSALGTLKSTWDDIPWWTKLVMLPPVFKAGSPAAGASAAGNVWAEEGRAAAGQSAGNRSFGFDLSPEEIARAKSTHSAYVNGEAGRGKSSFDFNLSPAEAMSARTQHSAFVSNLAELRSSLIRSGMPDREVAAYMQRAGFYNNPEALQQAVFTIRKHGPSGLFEHSADEAAAAGSRSFRFDLSPEEAARARASHEAFVREAASGRGSAAAGGQAAGREAATAGEAAADGGVSELANAGNAGRSSADEAMEAAKSADELVRRIETGTVDEMDKSWIEGLANAKAAGFENETINYVLAAARAAGIIK